MRIILAAVHGILNSQTDPTWPDRLDAWMFQRNVQVKVVKKEYFAAASPKWNAWVKNPRLAEGLANELELLKKADETAALWMVLHSNGTLIGLKAAKILIERGIRVDGIILVGAACPSDVRSNGVLDLIDSKKMGVAIAWSNHGDHTVPYTMTAEEKTEAGWWGVTKNWFWKKLAWPYCGLGHEGLRYKGDFVKQHDAKTVWFPETYQHSGYWSKENSDDSFARILNTISE